MSIIRRFFYMDINGNKCHQNEGNVKKQDRQKKT